MKNKEYREAISRNIGNIRRSLSLELLYKQSLLLKRLEDGTESKEDGRDFERYRIMSEIFQDDVSEKSLHQLKIFVSVSLNKKRNNSDVKIG